MNKTKAGSVYCGFRQNWQIAPNFLGKIFKTVTGVVGKVITGGAKLAISSITGGSTQAVAPTNIRTTTLREPINITIAAPAPVNKTFFERYGMFIGIGVVAIMLLFMVMKR